MKFLRCMSLIFLVKFLASCSSSFTPMNEAEIASLSNTELALSLHMARESVGTRAEATNEVRDEAFDRRLFTPQEYIRESDGKVTPGGSVFVVLAGFGIPHYVEEMVLTRTSETAIALYYYENLGPFSKRYAAFIKEGKFVGAARANREGNRVWWSEVGLVPTSYWKPAPDVGTLISVPKFVRVCRPADKAISCVSKMIGLFG